MAVPLQRSRPSPMLPESSLSGHLDDARRAGGQRASDRRAIGTSAEPSRGPSTSPPFFLVLKGDWAEAERYARSVIEIAERHGIAVRVALGLLHLAQVQIATGRVDEGLPKLREGYAMWASAGGKFHCSEYAARAADGLLAAGRLEEAEEFIAIGEQVQRDCEERLAEAELLRLRGRLLELADDAVAAEERYRRALEVAERQGAKLFSLRAAVDLARLINGQGRGTEARASLKPVYDWFTEGFDYPDLMRAKATLYALH